MDNLKTKYIMDIDYEEIGNRIGTRRKNMGIKQKDLAESLGITTSYLSNIERGVSTPSLDLIILLSFRLKVTPDFFLLGTLRASNTSLSIIDSLKLCSDKDLKIISEIIMSFVKHNYELKEGQK